MQDGLTWICGVHADEGEAVQDTVGGGDAGVGGADCGDAAAAAMVVILRGEVGAGKTTLVKGIAAALGAAAEDEVTSPTFTIVHEYVGTKVRLFHLDLYRLETEEQIAVLGLDEMAGYENCAGAGGVGRAVRERGEDGEWGDLYGARRGR